MISSKKMRNDKLNIKLFFIYHFYDYIFQQFGQCFYAISRAQVIIQSGSTIFNQLIGWIILKKKN